MKIAIHDVDGHNFPNLALMKISAWHKEQGDSVHWYNCFDTYDKAYFAKVFTFTPDISFPVTNAKEVVYGGTGYDVNSKLPDEIDSASPDYALYNCQHAYGFLTRGCIRKCSFCLVPKKEGDIRPYRDIEEVLAGKRTAVLMDNNILACDYGIRQIEKIGKMKVKVDFNQGLDARIIAQDQALARLLAKVKWLSPLRLALDNDDILPTFAKAFMRLRFAGVTPKAFSVYVLVKEIPSAHRRCRWLKSIGCDPFAMPYRDFESKQEPSQETKDFARWVNHKAIFKTTKWEDYHG
jgi:hypothetical protein